MLESTDPPTDEGTVPTRRDFSLENILSENGEEIHHPKLNGAPATGWDEESAEKPPTEGYCVECEGVLNI